MNVINTPMMTSAAAGSVPMAGSSLNPQAAGVMPMAGLFALEMGNLLAGMQSGDGQVQLPEGMEESDLTQMAELLALLQAWLAQPTASAETDLPEKLEAALRTFEGYLAAQPERLMAHQATAGQQQLIASLVEQGLSQEDAGKFLQLLQALSQETEASGHPAVKEVSKLASQLLAQFGLDVKPANKGQSAENKGILMPLMAKSRVTDRTAAYSGNPEAAGLQNLKLHRALATYQSEAGVAPVQQHAVEQHVRNFAAAVTVQVNPESEVEAPVIQTAPLQAGTPSGHFMAEKPEAGKMSYVVNADQFAQEMSDLFVKQMKVNTFRGMTEAKITLNPESLGKVDVKITAHNGVITAHFAAETANGKEILDTQLSQLRAALVQQGLQVDRLEVTQHQSSSFYFQQQREQSRQQPGQQQQAQTAHEDQPEFSLESLIEGVKEPAAPAWNRLRMARGVEYTA